ncbi:PepSY-associated TM helix domain-containing protein [Aristophania vespae]|uniref:PepSY-associated TM helix domain-containing protein n=1 Tax=Aristophania vespae TaxID=2697033 RepID=UPI0021105A6A|nr:PepSY-associated TM helix domain-containing protein [Aristophania vespae]
MLHDNLHLPALWGSLIIFIVSIGLFITLITGTWLHIKKFISDLCLFRPSAQKIRRWLDFHLIMGCISLPALIIISFSGIFLQYYKISAYFEASPPITTTPIQAIHDSSLNELLKKGEKEWGNSEGSFFLLTPQGINFIRGDDTNFCANRPHISANGLSSPVRLKCPTLRHFFLGMHDLHWADSSLRIIYGILGFIGSALIGSGLILFYNKNYNQKYNKNRKPFLFISPLIYRALNNGTLIGLPLASLALLWSARLDAPSFSNHDQWEILVFSSIWISSYLIALIFKNGFYILNSFLALSGLGLFFIDIITRGFISPHLAVFIMIDMAAFIIGLIGLYPLLKLCFFRKNLVKKSQKL